MKPRGITIRRQTQTESPQTGPAAIMDDTVYTMDDSTALMGGPVTVSQDIAAKTIRLKGVATIKKRR